MPEYYLATSEQDLQVADDKYFQTRLQELSKITSTSHLKNIQTTPSDNLENKSTADDLQVAASDANYDFMTHTYINTAKDDHKTKNAQFECEQNGRRPDLSPQCQFQLLSQSLIRRPDGSSNPSIDQSLTNQQGPPAGPLDDVNRVPVPAKRSPGSGKSASDQEDSEIFSAAENNVDETNQEAAALNEVTTALGKKGQQNGGAKKSNNISNIAMALFRIFSSTRHKKNGGNSGNQNGSKKSSAQPRSKSCDRVIDCDNDVNKGERNEGIRKSARFYHRSSDKTAKKEPKSATSSPLKRATSAQMPRSFSALTAEQNAVTSKHQEIKEFKGIEPLNHNKMEEFRSDAENSNRQSCASPSLLSLQTTEWEFQQNTTDDKLNGNDIHNDSADSLTDERLASLDFSTFHYSSVFNGYNNNMNSDIKNGAKNRERKSSGYDSLEGENSSLDSCASNGMNSQQKTAVNGGESNSYDTTGGTYIYQPLNKPNFQPDYNQVYAELDEITRLKLEIGRHPDLLNKNY